MLFERANDRGPKFAKAVTHTNTTTESITAYSIAVGPSSPRIMRSKIGAFSFMFTSAFS